MSADDKRVVKLESSLGGMFWFAGWLFTLAFAKLIWWQAILAIIVWPYYLGLLVK